MEGYSDKKIKPEQEPFLYSGSDCLWLPQFPVTTKQSTATKKILRIETEVFEKYENCVTIKECLYRSRCGRLPVGDGFSIFSHFFVCFSLPHSFRSFHRRNACECRGLGIFEVISIPPLAKPHRFECFSIAF